MIRSYAIAFMLFLGSGQLAFAQTEQIEMLFSAKSVTDRELALASVEDLAGQDPSAAMAIGVHKAFAALEQFTQSLYRHGFRRPRMLLIPMMRIPVPENPTPEPLTYDAWRDILQKLDTGLADAIATLGALPTDADAGFVADLRAVRFDMNGDGNLDESESIASILAVLSNPLRRVRRADADAKVPPPVFRFDRADGYWLQGYANFLRANVKLWLAHDFRRTFDLSFQLFFPGAGMQVERPPKKPNDDLLERIREAGSDDERKALRKQYQALPDEEKRRISRLQGSAIGNTLDLVTFIHTIDWPVVDANARRDIRTHILEMIRLSRLNWQAVLAEEDNDREWLPGPKQPGRHPLTALQITDETVEGWHEVLSTVEQVLEGEVLLPHFRFPGKSVNLRRFFDEPTPFDLVLTITGPGALPYVETGDMLDIKEWRRTIRRFGRGNVLSYAIWIN